MTPLEQLLDDYDNAYFGWVSAEPGPGKPDDAPTVALDAARQAILERFADLISTEDAYVKLVVELTETYAKVKALEAKVAAYERPPKTAGEALFLNWTWLFGRINELEADKRRLDWLLKQGPAYSGGDCILVVVVDRGDIDAAMGESE